MKKSFTKSFTGREIYEAMEEKVSGIPVKSEVRDDNLEEFGYRLPNTYDELSIPSEQE